MRQVLLPALLAILLSCGVARAVEPEYYDWCWSDKMPVWATNDELRLTGNNAAKAVDAHEWGSNALFAGCVFENHTDGKIYYRQWQTNQFRDRERPWAAYQGYNAALAIAENDDEEEDQKFSFWYDPPSDNRYRYADTLLLDIVDIDDDWNHKTTFGEDGSCEDVAIDAWRTAGNEWAVIAFRDDPESGDEGIFCSYSSNRGETWQGPVRVVTTSTAANIGIAAEQGDDYVYIVYHDVADGDKVYLGEIVGTQYYLIDIWRGAG